VAVTKVIKAMIDNIRRMLRTSFQIGSFKKAVNEQDHDFGSSIAILRCLQLMTDYSHSEMQDFLHDQHSPSSSDIISEISTLLNVVVAGSAVGIHYETNNIHIVIEIVITLSEFINGPCVSNQLAMITAKVLLTCTNILAWSAEDIKLNGFQLGNEDPDVLYLKQLTVQFLNEMCVGSNHVILLRLKTILEPVSLLQRMTWLYQRFLDIYGEDIGAHKIALEYAITQSFSTYKGESASKRGMIMKPLPKGEMVWTVPRANMIHLPAQAFAGETGCRGGGAVQEGFSIFQLLVQVGEYFSIDLLQNYHMTNAEAEAHSFYKGLTARIEIMKRGKLERVHFTIPPVCAYLTEKTRDDVVWGVPRTDPATKVQSFQDMKDVLINEMIYHEKLNEAPLLRFFADNNTEIKNLSFSLCCVLNLCFLFGEYGNATDLASIGGVGEPNTSRIVADDLDEFIFYGSIVQLFMAAAVALSYFTANAPIFICQGWMERVKEATNERKMSQEQGTESMLGFGQWLVASIVSDETMTEANCLLNYGPDTWQKDYVSSDKAEKLRHSNRMDNNVILQASMTVTCLHMIMNMYYLLRDPRIVYQFCYVLLSVLGVMYDHLLLSVLLLDVVFKYSTLTNVLKAVLLRSRQLVMVLLLTLVVMFIFSALSFMSFRHYYYSPFITNVGTAAGVTTSSGLEGNGKGGFACDSVMNCYVTAIMYGLGDGRGLKAAQVQPEYPEGSSIFWDWSTLHNSEQSIAVSFWERQMFDLAFFVIIIVILRSMIFGIILASFAQLREAESKAAEEMSSKCFICSIERTEFDRNALGFDYHIKHDHNMWNYLYFIVKVMQTEPEYFTTMELFVHEKVKASDISWFPLHRALVLEMQKANESSKLEKSMDKLVERQEALEQDLMATLTAMKIEMKKLQPGNDSGPFASSPEVSLSNAPRSRIPPSLPSLPQQ